MQYCHLDGCDLPWPSGCHMPCILAVGQKAHGQQLVVVDRDATVIWSLWPPICNNGQAIMFYSCDLFYFFVLCIFEAKERHLAGPLSGRRNVVLFYNAWMDPTHVHLCSE